ncbi:MAG: cob(I)yrinic acid a,c-diamide adenosyltransferase [Candidatus Liptonbacteria bacterium]|nr:cob(I)yrinic acid a,c-diamide adenosyltransferase [Candidatus Liptonbacteria bacterium]
MLLVFTGNGKGKTTAALGQALRLVGDGKRVLMVQFIKGPWHSGEEDSAKLLGPNFKIVKKGKGFVGIFGDKLPREEHMKAAQEALAFADKEIQSGKWEVVILDEVNNAVSLGLITEKSVEKVLHRAHQKVEHVILTGRNAAPEFIEEADLVTEMREVKHPYAGGVMGVKGVEY